MFARDEILQGDYEDSKSILLLKGVHSALSPVAEYQVQKRAYLKAMAVLNENGDIIGIENVCVPKPPESWHCTHQNVRRLLIPKTPYTPIVTGGSSNIKMEHRSRQPTEPCRMIISKVNFFFISFHFYFSFSFFPDSIWFYYSFHFLFFLFSLQVLRYYSSKRQ